MVDEAEKQKYDYDKFAQDIAMQAKDVMPVDMSKENAEYIVNIVYSFCKLAAEGVLKDKKSQIPLQGSLNVAQCVAEWTFHKALDLTRAGISGQPRDVVLKDIAFVVFEVAKLVISKQLSEEQAVNTIDHHVKKKYTSSLTELLEKGIISQENFNAAMGQSNFDQMAQENETNQQQNTQQAGDEEEFSTSKTLKLASLAMLLQKMPPNKVQSILSKMPPREANIINSYLSMENLTSNANPTVMKYINDLQNKMPKVEFKGDKLQQKLSKIVTNKNETKINDIISKERDIVKSFILSIKEKKQIELPTAISNVIYEHLLDKINK